MSMRIRLCTDYLHLHSPFCYGRDILKFGITDKPMDADTLSAWENPKKQSVTCQSIVLDTSYAAVGLTSV